jgi:chemotaxis protein CheX
VQSVKDIAALTPGQENWPSLLQDAAREVFSMMLNCEIQPAPPGATMPKTEFTAMVGLAGKLCGVCSLHCSPGAAGLMASKMLGLDPAEAGDEIWDAVGEVCNMVAGNFKNKLAGLSEHCMLSCPTVIAGNDYKCRSLAARQAMTVTLLFEGDPFSVVLEIHD